MSQVPRRAGQQGFFASLIRGLDQAVAAGQRQRSLARALDPATACKGLVHLPEKRDDFHRDCGSAYVICWHFVAEARAAHTALQKLSFYSGSDSLALSFAVEHVVELGKKLDQLDGSLSRATGRQTTLHTNVYWAPVSLFNNGLSYAEGTQSTLELFYGGRDGADGEWFRRVLKKRAEVIKALLTSAREVQRAREKAVWMVARQQERGAYDEVELINVDLMRSEVLGFTQTVSALTEGVGEVYMDPFIRL